MANPHNTHPFVSKIAEYFQYIKPFHGFKLFTIHHAICFTNSDIDKLKYYNITYTKCAKMSIFIQSKDQYTKQFRIYNKYPRKIIMQIMESIYSLMKDTTPSNNGCKYGYNFIENHDELDIVDLSFLKRYQIKVTNNYMCQSKKGSSFDYPYMVALYPEKIEKRKP